MPARKQMTRLPRLATISLAIIGLLATLALWGATSQVWEISDYDAFLVGRFENVSLTAEGRLLLGPRVETVFESDQPLLWAVAEAPDGSIYAATGHQGHVYEVKPDGESRLLWKAPEIEVFAIAVGPDGAVYAGTSPNGKVYRVDADGQAGVYFDPQETYIWSLAFTPGVSEPGTLFVGTGEEGKIYWVSAPGQGEVYFETGQRHVVSLAFDGTGRLLAGTDPNGVLYRIDEKEKAFALYDADLPEVRDLQVVDGDIYAAALGGGVVLSPEGVPVTVGSAGGVGTPNIRVTANVGDDPGLETAPAQPQTSASEPTPVVTISQSAITYEGMEKAAILRVRPDLTVEKAWSSRRENLLALRIVESDQRRVIFATDRFGRLYSLDDAGASLLAQTDQNQVTQLIDSKAGLLVATAHSGKLLRLSRDPAPEGVYETAVRDTGKVSRWGRLSWQANLPERSEIVFSTRSGNSARPDASWSSWSDPVRAAAGVAEGDAAITSPPARYIQWKAQFHGGGGGPVLDRVRITYLPQNSPPVIHDITVSASSADSSGSGASSSNAGAAASDSASFSITVTDSADPSSPGASSTAGQTIEAALSRKMTIGWRADDPDGDKLLAALDFRGEGESVWKLLKRDVTESSWTLDSHALADGTYRFRVTVSDGAVNPPGDARSAERISQPVLLDQTPPAVRLVGVDGRTAARFEAADAASALQRAEYSINAGAWVPLHADDGIVDSRDESFTVNLSGLDPGEHLVTLRVLDRAGNAGLGKAVIR